MTKRDDDMRDRVDAIATTASRLRNRLQTDLTELEGWDGGPHGLGRLECVYDTLRGLTNIEAELRYILGELGEGR